VSEPNISSTPRPDTTPWPGNVALAAIYCRAIERFEEERKGGPSITAPDDAMKGSMRDRAKTIISE
jgi:hypothetical protein